eukprot:CAMPEP_0182432864 /NCGR_PEP_ID=MMETSP1167-20130531/59429_1 /TAXON_ID=2988 /ORGANISM="Mallomonas Sp, Strain CCMP3275" /LENGTH=41 /DNA_ID= /DNA_START= /DNA_END= /DNA_ORIENTATION=
MTDITEDIYKYDDDIETVMRENKRFKEFQGDRVLISTISVL